MSAESVALTVDGSVRPATPEFGQIVRRYQRTVLSLALNLTGNHHDAEDLAQEAFLRAYQGIGRFRGDADPGTWLHRIVVNAHVDRCRTPSRRLAKVHRSWDDDEERITLPPDGHPARDPERTTQSAAIQRHIDWALEQLSPQQRTVFVLRHYHEHKLREIASMLDVSEGTVKSALFRAIQRLQEALSFYRPELGLEEKS